MTSLNAENGKSSRMYSHSTKRHQANMKQTHTQKNSRKKKTNLSLSSERAMLSLFLLGAHGVNLLIYLCRNSIDSLLLHHTHGFFFLCNSASTQHSLYWIVFTFPISSYPLCVFVLSLSLTHTFLLHPTVFHARCPWYLTTFFFCHCASATV